MFFKVIFSILILLVLSFSSFGFSSDFLISFGYDSNPASERDRSGGSFFEEISLDFSSNLFGFDFLGDGQFLDYQDVPDVFVFSFEVKKSLLKQPSFFDVNFFSGFSVYRNGLVTEDENNSFYVGSFSSWLLSDRISLNILFRFDRRSFLHFDTVKRYMRHRKRFFSSHGDGISNEFFEKVSRYDLSYFLRIEPSIFFSRLFLAFSLSLNKNDSSFEVEDYFSWGFSWDYSFVLSEKFLLDISFLWQRFEYDKAPMKINRIDYFRFYSFRFSYDFSNKSSVYAQIEHINNQSPLKLENYEKTVLKCGFVFYF